MWGFLRISLWLWAWRSRLYLRIRLWAYACRCRLFLMILLWRLRVIPYSTKFDDTCGFVPLLYRIFSQTTLATAKQKARQMAVGLCILWLFRRWRRLSCWEEAANWSTDNTSAPAPCLICWRPCGSQGRSQTGSMIFPLSSRGFCFLVDCLDPPGPPGALALTAGTWNNMQC